MAFLRPSFAQDPQILLQTKRLSLRIPAMIDYAPWAALRAESRDHLTPWEPSWARDELSRSAFRRRLRQQLRDIREDQSYPLFVFRAPDEALLGGLTLSNVRRGVTQAASLGYWLGRPHTGQGYMIEAVRAAALFVFDELKLHRLEAACLTGNLASIAVLRRCGFAEEGLARQYLKIDGRWQDHLLFALLTDDPRDAPAARA